MDSRPVLTAPWCSIGGAPACYRAVRALLAAAGAWSKLMGWAPFRSWAEQARGGVVADVEGALAAPRARERVAAAGMAR